MRFSRKVLLVFAGAISMGWLTSTLFFRESKDIPSSIYDLKMTSLSGEQIDFDRYRGKKLLIVNTASKCGYTYQYKQLQELHEKYSNSVTVLGFPSNDFLWQEPGTNEEIASFCERNFGVTFQLFDKVSVKGRDQHPLFTWLKSKSGKQPSWNFCKYLVNEQGEFIAFFPPKVEPLSPEIISLLE